MLKNSLSLPSVTLERQELSVATFGIRRILQKGNGIAPFYPHGKQDMTCQSENAYETEYHIGRYDCPNLRRNPTSFP